MSNTIVSNFGNYNPIDPSIIAYVNAAIQTANADSVQASPPSVINGIAQYVDGTGKLIKSTPYTMPDTLGAAGQVLEVDAGGNIVYGAGGPPVNPTYLPTLTVTALSQGPNALVQNYTLPNYAPPPNSLLANATTYIMTFTVNASISFRVDTISNGTIRFTEIIPIGIYLISDILLQLEVRVRSVFNANNVIADIIFGYDNLTDRFSMTLTAGTNPSNFVNFWWEAYEVFPVPNNNNLFGIGQIIEPQLVLPPISTATCQNAPIGVSLGTDCVWRSFASVQISGIQSDSGSVSIQCEDVGTGQSGIISYGDYNVNNGSINNCGNINALDNCNITTGTTQIVNGLSELNININSLPRITQNAIKTKIECGASSLQLAAISDGTSPDTVTYIGASDTANIKNTVSLYLPNQYQILQNNGAIQRMVVDNDSTKLYSKSVQTGPSGSYLNLNDDSSFTIGTYSDGNGLIDCRTNSLALAGPQAKSSFVLTDSTITTSLFNGSYRADREIMDATSQVFKDGNLAERLRIDNNGVAINGEYALPLLDGLANQVLTTSGAGVTSWQTPTATNPFNQTLNTTDDVSFNTVTTSKVDALTTLTIGGLSATSVNIGKAAITTTLKGTTSIDSLFTMPTTAGNSGDVLTKNGLGGTVWQAPQITGLFSQTGIQTVANTNVETTLIGVGVGSLSVPANYFTTGMVFRYSTGGLFRDAANGTVFRFRLRNSGVLFDSGNLTLPNITALTAWNTDTTFSYVGGTTMITNFNFQYNNGSDARGFTSQNSNNTFNPAIPNTLNFTVQWTVARVNNTIQTNYGVLEKVY